MRCLVTGGCGFIGSAFVRRMIKDRRASAILNLDVLTYAANPMNLAGADTDPAYRFSKTDLCDSESVGAIVTKFRPDVVVHFAAESHVDRSIVNPGAFIHTNVLGTYHLLEACRALNSPPLFVHISTDEVFGSLGQTGKFSETTPYAPNSPYSASKAASDMLVRSYHHTYGMRTLITNCSNNYGPFQFPEKLIPLMILHASSGKPLPVYGDGQNVRDWIYVEDHVEGVFAAIEKGTPGETYCFGGNSEMKNLDVVRELCRCVAERMGRPVDEVLGQIEFVKDRPGHDLRYAIDSSKAELDLDWRPNHSFSEGLRNTVDWYLTHTDWVESVQTGAYRDWIRQHYGGDTA